MVIPATINTSYLWKEERQDDKADPVDNAGKLESIGNCWEKRPGRTLTKTSTWGTVEAGKVCEMSSVER